MFAPSQPRRPNTTSGGTDPDPQRVLAIETLVKGCINEFAARVVFLQNELRQEGFDVPTLIRSGRLWQHIHDRLDRAIITELLYQNACSLEEQHPQAQVCPMGIARAIWRAYCCQTLNSSERDVVELRSFLYEGSPLEISARSRRPESSSQMCPNELLRQVPGGHYSNLLSGASGFGMLDIRELSTSPIGVQWVDNCGDPLLFPHLIVPADSLHTVESFIKDPRAPHGDNSDGLHDLHLLTSKGRISLDVAPRHAKPSTAGTKYKELFSPLCFL